MTDQTSADRTKALDQALGQIEKHYGKGAIMRLGAEEKLDVAVIPTGCLSLDLALGIGGIPRGRVVEIYGPESSGKTTLALHVIAEAQRKGGVAAFIDAEHALDVVYARKLGVRTEDLLISQPDSGEQAMEIAEILVRSNAIDVGGGGFGGRPGAPLRNRRRHGGRPDGLPGPPHVPGPAQAHLGHQQVHDLGDLHQPDPPQDRGDVRQPRDHHRRQRPEVLRLHAPGHPQDRAPSSRAMKSSGSTPGSKW